MAHALAAHAVSTAAADHFVRPGAGILLGGAVVPFCTLTPGTQSSWVTQADSTLIGAIAVVTDGTVGLCLSLAFTLTLKVDCDLQRVFKAHWFDGKGLALFLGTAPGPSFYAKGHLER